AGRIGVTLFGEREIAGQHGGLGIRILAAAQAVDRGFGSGQIAGADQRPNEDHLGWNIFRLEKKRLAILGDRTRHVAALLNSTTQEEMGLAALRLEGHKRREGLTRLLGLAGRKQGLAANIEYNGIIQRGTR